MRFYWDFFKFERSYPGFSMIISNVFNGRNLNGEIGTATVTICGTMLLEGFCNECFVERFSLHHSVIECVCN